MNTVDTSWMPAANMKRIICHWTAGAHRASPLEKKSYHIVIEGDGTLVRGLHSIKDNESTRDGNYAAHTLGCNTGSIGISVCCMAGAQEHPFDPGNFPMTEVQWRKMAEVAADLCKTYNIPVTPTTVLGHGEVQRNLNIKQKGKWDPMVLTWESELSPSQVGNRFRELVKAFIQGAGEDETQGANVQASINGAHLTGSLVANEEAYLKVSSLTEGLGWMLLNASADSMVVLPAGREDVIYLTPEFLEPTVSIPGGSEEAEIVSLVLEKGYVLASQLAEELNLPIAFDGNADTLAIGVAAAPAPAAATTRIVVKSGDTLSAIAARHLGSGRRWKELLDVDGNPFDDKKARKIKPGDLVLVPTAAAPPTAGPAARSPAEPAAAPAPAEPAPKAPRPVSGFDVDSLIDAANPALRKFAKVSIPVIVAECVASGVTNPAQVAYVLATSEHESLAGKFMSELWGPTAAQRKYEGRKDLGNTQKGDGFRFRGRGYVQVTGRANYETWGKRLREDIVNHPDLVSSRPEIAATILVQGMKDGAFRGKHKLANYFDGVTNDFRSAREIINGDKVIVDRGQSLDRGTRIANMAQRYLAAMSSDT
ncbi:N-acetylmuramoyl-L-alanine amidase [uncultured Thiodictyon sp.]|uniref:N-acetylmuramoyl-L-alanine amidase n=1 Tax=uncultured Thiodictyon sp. TaxID=1846217 RepID=UPI0025E8E097|nr:N-acetylmuramoyl-L-alanine amidase [uncultured Thiodictyon sp.]